MTAVLLGTFIPVYADGETVSKEFDATIPGSITIYKYVNNDGSWFDGNGQELNPDEYDQTDAVQGVTGNYRMLPEQGVEFSYLKIADAVTITEDDNAGFYFDNLDAGFLEIIKTDYGIELQPDDKYTEEDYYAPYDVTEAMLELIKQPANSNTEHTGETTIREYVKEHGTQFAEATDEFGRTAVENLPVGLYLVSEINWEHQAISKHDTYWERVDVENGTTEGGDGSEYSDIASPSSPFLVQIPITNIDEITTGGVTYEAGTVWQYDVTAYPKNGTINIHKDIITNDHADNPVDGLDTVDTETLCDYEKQNSVDGGTPVDGVNKSGLTHQIDANIGDTISQVISVDVPVLEEGKNIDKFSVTDRMTKSLEFSRIVSLSYGPYAWNDERNTTVPSGYYSLSVAGGKKEFTVNVTNFNLFNRDEQCYFYIEFESILTPDAVIGTDTADHVTDQGETISANNQNTARLDFSTDHTSEHSYYSNTPKVYTYEIDINKTFTNDENVNYTDVTYTVIADTATDIESVIWTKEAPGIYHVYDEAADGEYDPDADTLETKDSKTVTKYISPDSNGKLQLKGVDARTYEFMEVKTSEGSSLLAEPFSIRLVANKPEDEYEVKYEDGTLNHAYVWSGAEPDNLDDYDLLNTSVASRLEQGRAEITVLNDTGITLLRTGGKGSLVFIIVGGAAVLAGVVYLVVRNKEKNKEQESDNEEMD